MANEPKRKRISPELAPENRTKGGQASAAGRERQRLREELRALLADGDTQEKLCLALVEQAQRGNIKAFEVIRDTMGEKPSEVINISGEVNIGDARARLHEKLSKQRIE